MTWSMKPLNRHQGAESHTQRNLWGSALGQRLPALSVVKEPVVAEMLNHSSQHLQLAGMESSCRGWELLVQLQGLELLVPLISSLRRE
mmetsp:Transcript_24501/g.39881  ORF Transcript_24501/g.39881 Transcript_24501/m.39881 type:complete len:88 (+) Transcript_24501:436-699(+)